MGMFDYVRIDGDREVHCVECGKDMRGNSEFQTKDTDCILVTVSYRDSRIQNCYGDCQHCGASNDLYRTDVRKPELTEWPLEAIQTIGDDDDDQDY